MNRRHAFAIVGTVTLGVLVVLALTGNQRRWDWTPGWDPDSREPYGMAVLAELLPGYTGGELERVTGPLTEGGLRPEGGSYLFVGREPRYLPGELDTLLAWVAAGGTAFFAAEWWADSLASRLGHNEPDEDVWFRERRRELRADFTASPLRLPDAHVLHLRTRDRRPWVDWSLIDTAYTFWSFPGARPLALTEEGCIFLGLGHGAGRLFFLTTPVALSNRAWTEPAGRDFAERLLSHLPPGPVALDHGVRPRLGGAPPPPVGPLRFVLQQPALRQAWYGLLLLALLYLLFRGKRRQAPIPLLDPKENRSLAFLEGVAELYAAQRDDHGDMARLLREHVREELRRRYRVATGPSAEGPPPAERVRLLAARSGAPEALVADLLRRLDESETAVRVDDRTFLGLHRTVQAFRQQAAS